MVNDNNVWFKEVLKGDMAVWIIFFLLCTISVVEVFSASSTLSFKSGDHWAPISGHLTLLIVGALLVWIVHKIPCNKFWIGVFLLPISWIMLIFVMVMSAAVNGANRWIDLGFIQFQPSEVAKMANIIVVALILAIFQRGDKGASPQAFRWIMIVTIPTVILIGVENLSTAILLTGTVYLMMFVGRIPTRQMLMITGIGVGFVLLSFAAVKYVPTKAWETVGLDRMTTWKARIETRFKSEKVPPEKFNINEDAQIAHANIAIATSNIAGKGPGNSVERDFLSQAFSDFIFAIIIEELGLAGGAFVAFLYIFLMMRISKIARKCNNAYYSFLIMGIGILLVTQAMFNMLVAVGIMPVTGQPLPLISKGGTSTLINCCYIGIILNVSQYVEKSKQPDMQIS